MVHVLTNRQQQIHYSWGELSDTEPGEGDDKIYGHATTKENCSVSYGSIVEQGRELLTRFLYKLNMSGETIKTVIEG